ncbi:MAG: rhodanese-related sulfurtransferase [Alphaproteobacteria bacterium]|nr:rhodanese-related sulfurtransferase [Alphaproteobacteria bacterium]
MADMLGWLSRWYLARCDGEWEHRHGVSIETLDNPGWLMAIDLAGTPLLGVPFARTEMKRGAFDWVHAWVEEGRFRAAGGALNLAEMIGLFRVFAEAYGCGPPEAAEAGTQAPLAAFARRSGALPPE